MRDTSRAMVWREVERLDTVVVVQILQSKLCGWDC